MHAYTEGDPQHSTQLPFWRVLEGRIALYVANNAGLAGMVHDCRATVNKLQFLCLGRRLLHQLQA